MTGLNVVADHRGMMTRRTRNQHGRLSRYLSLRDIEERDIAAKPILTDTDCTMTAATPDEHMWHTNLRRHTSTVPLITTFTYRRNDPMAWSAAPTPTKLPFSGRHCVYSPNICSRA